MTLRRTSTRPAVVRRREFQRRRQEGRAAPKCLAFRVAYRTSRSGSDRRARGQVWSDDEGRRRRMPVPIMWGRQIRSRCSTAPSRGMQDRHGSGRYYRIRHPDSNIGIGPSPLERVGGRHSKGLRRRPLVIPMLGAAEERVAPWPFGTTIAPPSQGEWVGGRELRRPRGGRPGCPRQFGSRERQISRNAEAQSRGPSPASRGDGGRAAGRLERTRVRVGSRVGWSWFA